MDEFMPILKLKAEVYFLDGVFERGKVYFKRHHVFGNPQLTLAVIHIFMDPQYADIYICITNQSTFRQTQITTETSAESNLSELVQVIQLIPRPIFYRRGISHNCMDLP